MLVKGLFTHFNNETKVIMFSPMTANGNKIIEWEGNVKDLKDGSKNTYNYSNVYDWYVNKEGILEITLK